ncbi:MULTISPECIES: SAP domain-containing protein [Pediococcus]|uniref:SAP domain-containing protein n=1 Tax=Pediococcus pentosaceus (strain ATCC 25745 / CCUG 21536 / LMG 10740 / 183-1w) TaxID=278197 RepID=Q03D75_PEDPA|nr:MULTISPECIES: SAP domain-containing protein [Pediococcus]ABJ68847.1 hypothetical protein PEPE_1828 [Pediococcus pentosaceus ATCC 25745]KAF5440006.1 hypothetical protein HFC69_03525 [Pediococcus sp. EKM202D]KAF5440552.1 hypothetical protein HFC68_04285 [Pediococcus sp. EKM201D]MCI2961371.1 SAP domain-containing protein [Pediococcus pentosaceus]QHM65361.1 hypothetical protein C7M48_01102 [Pediococcus pentosaceus]
MMVLTLKDFEQTYFYKTELIQLCKVYGLPTYGTKAELNKYLTLYLSGTPACDIKVNRKHTTSRNKTKITLETKILGEGFSFNQEARKLFAEYFGKEKFSFKKEMAVIKRQAEHNGETKMTVRDLLERYQEMVGQGNVLRETAEEATYQWNNFVRDFCKSSESQNYHQKLKVAAILWEKVKNSKNDKKFEASLVQKYEKNISNYMNK